MNEHRANIRKRSVRVTLGHRNFSVYPILLHICVDPVCPQMLAKFITRCHENGLFSEFDLTHPLGEVYYSYALDPVGNRTSATEASGRTLSWSYDGVNCQRSLEIDPFALT